MFKKDDKREEEDITLDEEEASPKDAIQRLRGRLLRSEEEKKEYLDGWQRARAEMQNFKKDLEKDSMRARQALKEGLFSDMLPVADNFELAFRNKEAWEKVDVNWRNGVEYIYKELLSVLASHGVTPFDDTGREFDPARHHSVENISVEEKKDNGKILEVVQKGYEHNGKILRPAQVKVGEYIKG